MSADTRQVVKRMLFENPDGISPKDIMDVTGVNYTSANEHLRRLNAVRIGYGRYTLEPDEEDIRFARAVLKRTG